MPGSVPAASGKLAGPKVRVRLLVSSSAWLEAWVAGAYVVVEYHRPRRESSVGWVDRPVRAAGELPDLLLLVRRAIDGVLDLDAGDVTAALAGRIAAARLAASRLAST